MISRAKKIKQQLLIPTLKTRFEFLLKHGNRSGFSSSLPTISHLELVVNGNQQEAS